MAQESKLFHESWYRIAGQRITLRPSVVVQRQMYRAAKWYVLRDPFSNQFYRLNPGTYEFISRLKSDRTVEEVWKETMSRDPEGVPGQGEVIELLGQLYHANLLHYDLAPNSVKLFERYRKKKQRIFRANLMNIMFFRIPLYDPDSLLQRILPFINRLISRQGAALWLLAVGFGIKVAIDHWGELKLQSDGILAPSNLFLLYAGIVLVKALHEFGHAFAVRRFGGEVHVMGVMFLIFSPLPYMDASAAWSFRNKWERVFVGAAGMIFEAFVASIAIIVWANTGPGVIHSLAYNMVFVASVSTLLFNLNPLLRYDGYYIFSDLLDVPNLHQKATQHLTYLVERHAFACENAQTPAKSPKEGRWLAAFAILSGLYRILVFSSILLFVADRFLLLGLIAAVICGIAWVVVPTVKLISYLASSPRLYRTRSRAVSVCAGTFAVLFIFLYFCPFPFNFKAPGVLKSVDYLIAANKIEGRVQEILAPSGTKVSRGDGLLRLENPELMLRIRENQAGVEEAKALYQKAMQNHQADLKPIQSRMEYYGKRLQRLFEDRDNLIVRSATDGIWIAPDAKDYLGMWLPRGTQLGQLVNQGQFYFVSVVSEEDVSGLFGQGAPRSEIRLKGQSHLRIPVGKMDAIPMEQTHLPSPALGWDGGGDIPIDTRDQHGVKTAEPYYQVRAYINGETRAALLNGRSGKIRFALSPKPILWQAWRKLRQLVQKRYQV